MNKSLEESDPRSRRKLTVEKQVQERKSFLGDNTGKTNGDISEKEKQNPDLKKKKMNK